MKNENEIDYGAEFDALIGLTPAEPENPTERDNEVTELLDRVGVEPETLNRQYETPSTIENLKRSLAFARIRFTNLTQDLAPLEEQRRAKIASVVNAFNRKNAEALKELAEAEILADKADQLLREALVSWHKKTGEKTYDKELSVAVSTKLSYSEEDAIAWAKVNAPIMVETKEILNKKAFESLPQAADLKFVTKNETPTPRIAKVLSEVEC